MRFVPAILLVLALPAGILGYTLGAAVVSALPLPEVAEGVIVMFVPLLVGGLFMLPFIIPLFDRMAKRDLEAYRRSKESVGNGRGDKPGGGD